MDTIQIEKDTIKELIRESMREVIHEERMNFYKAIIPTVSDEEMQDIIQKSGAPSDYDIDDFEEFDEI
jgi:predicted ribonuclease toxin of YeeF-YezG toxin-antitoxin module